MLVIYNYTECSLYSKTLNVYNGFVFLIAPSICFLSIFKNNGESFLYFSCLRFIDERAVFDRYRQREVKEKQMQDLGCHLLVSFLLILTYVAV